jgi:hypothetical protein
MQTMVAWTAEEGGRTLFYVAVAGSESHGLLLDECKVEKYGVPLQVVIGCCVC